MLQAIIWDVDGTLAETEIDGHRRAFNAAFEALGLPWRWSVPRYVELLAVAGGRERLMHDLASRADAPSDAAAREALAADLHAEKNRRYAQIVAEAGIDLRPGVRALIDEAGAAGLRLAIATTTSRANVEALLGAQLGSDWRERFAAVVCAEDAPLKKPHPQAYRMSLERLGLSGPDALAIEDSPNGVEAATAAGLPVLVTRSLPFAGADFGAAMAVCDDLEQPATASPLLQAPAAARPDLATLLDWHASWAELSRGR